jgi:UDPglucose 6-dehydrogenase
VLFRSAVAGTNVTFICVGTPCQQSGEIDLAAVRDVAAEIGGALKEKSGYHVVVMKSTVVPSTTDSVLIPILEERSGKKAGKDFGVAMNPEFLREGYAVRDFMEGDRVVIGGIDERSAETVRALYAGLRVPIMLTGLRTAEMIKYASNSFLATKISFINEVANVCERLGIDVYEVAKGMGMDRRISPHFLSAGIGFGGSCFPKDVTALAFLAKNLGYKPVMLDAALSVNEAQPYRLVELAEKALGTLQQKRIAVLGLAFKDNTDDMREAPSIKIINKLLEKGASVVAFDPQAVDNAMKIWGGKIGYAKSASDALSDADACLVVTEWDEFGKINAAEFKTRMRNALVIEGRKVLDRDALVKAGVHYIGVGRLKG